ncbi:MAG: hypothetical protein PHV98_06985 [Candidatus Omnitrophica bacterium]|jgi:hypothetical protein|nr:hypothetical protein [Candidatus Omnitrophota bacterium]
MMHTAMEREKERRFRYQVQAGPEWTRLVVEFKETQHELLRQFMELLLNTPGNKGEDVDNAPEAANEGSGEAMASSNYIADVAL